MGSSTPDNGDWKGGHMRIDSNEARSEDLAKADEVDLDLPDTTTPPGTSAAAAANANRSGSRNRNKFPRLGLDTLIHESRPEAHAGEDGAFQFYKVYKRRWFGLAQLTLLNIIISWDVSIFSSISPPLVPCSDTASREKPGFCDGVSLHVKKSLGCPCISRSI